MRVVHRLSLFGLAIAVLSAAFFFAADREERRLLDDFIARALNGVDRADTSAVVLALSHRVHESTNRGVPADSLDLYEWLESTSVFNMTTAVSLRRGAFGVVGHEPFGPCGTMTRVLLNACWRLGIPARKLQLIPESAATPEIHTLVEWRSGGRWQVVSPSDDFAWRARDGRWATIEEIGADTAIAAQVRDRNPWFRYTFGRPRHMRWEKLPAPGRAAIRTLLGERRYEAMETPRLYDQPRKLLLGVALLGVLCCSLGALATRAARRALW